MKTKLAPSVVVALLLLISSSYAQDKTFQRVGGTLIVAVPVEEGLVACSDKRLYNETTGTSTDDSVKIHKVGSNALFVATNTTGFLDKTTGKIEFNVFDIIDGYVSQHSLSSGRQFWDGLKKDIRDQLREYLSKREYKDWPSTDTKNNDLLFNLVFYSVEGKGIRSYSMSVFYEKAPTPVINISDVTSEEVNTPKLSGKGKEVMDYIAKDPQLGQDPSILRFDQSYFDAAKTSGADAVDFARRLFLLTNKALPQAEVSATYDCALLSYQTGFQWINHGSSTAMK
jgi:hypothetical protein